MLILPVASPVGAIVALALGALFGFAFIRDYRSSPRG